LAIARVLLNNPAFLEDNARVVSTGVASDLKSLSSIDEQLIELAKEIREIEAEMKASSDP
jgi:U3 small nucleolar ribonucleoprotein component